VDREIKEATYHAGMGKFQKEYIVKCVKAAYLLVGKLVDAEATTNDNGGKRRSSDNNNFHNNNNNNRRSNNNNNNHEELILPTPRDIDEDIISITENDQTGEIVDVTFNLYRQQQDNNTTTTTFNWDIQGADDDDDNEMFSFGDNDGRKKVGRNNHKSTSSSSSNNNNNNQDDDKNNQLGNMLGALGKLFYILFTEGESVPNNTDDDVVVDVDGYNSTIATTTPVTNSANSSSSSTTMSRKRKVNSSSSRDSSNNNNNEKKKGSSSKESKVSKKKSREEEAILDILLNFAMPGDTDREDDYIIESMKKVGNLPIHLCRFVSDLLYSARVSEKNDDGGGGGGNGGDTTATTAPTTAGNNHHHQQQQHLHHKDSIFTSLSDVHSDLKQMIDFPDAFLYGTVNSRWEIVFGSNHVFGREKEMQLLMNAVRRIQSLSNDSMARQQQQQQQQQFQMIHPHHHQLQQRRTKEVVIISGHAGTGKSLLVQEIRKPLQAQGWIFLRCKFEKKMYPEPLSVIALGFDEFFASCALCSKDVTAVTDAGVQQSCCCSNGCCSRKICEKLERFIGLAGLTTLSQLMPSLRRILNDVYPNRYFHGDEGLGTTNNVRGQNHQHLFVTLLDVLSQLRPVLFFTDDVSPPFIFCTTIFFQVFFACCSLFFTPNICIISVTICGGCLAGITKWPDK